MKLKRIKRDCNWLCFLKHWSLIIKGDSEEAIRLCQEGAKLCFEIRDSLQAAKHLTNAGAFYQQQGQKDQALSFYLEAYPIFDQLGEEKLLSRVLNNVAILYRQQEQYDKAIDIYYQSLAIRKKQSDTLGIAVIYMNLGLLYGHVDQADKAESHLLEALQIFSAKGVQNEIANCNNALGNVYFNLACYQEARPFLEAAYKHYQQHSDIWNQTSNAFLLGSLDLQEGKHHRAEQFLQEAIDLNKTANRWGESHDLFFNLSSVQHSLGKNAAAYQSLLSAYEQLDSIKEERRLALTEENLARFEVLEKEKALVLNQLTLERRTRQRNSLITGLLLFISIAIGLVLFLRQRILIANQKTALQQQKIQQLQQEKKINCS